MKAKWEFSAITNGDWTVISNEAECDDAARVQSLKDVVDEAKGLFSDKEITFTDAKTTVFPLSFKISPYLYAFVAGPFGFFERKTEGMPVMRIYARESLVKDIRHEEMFTATEVGISFYSEFFGRAYPFRKYDQVFVPEHVCGAMENVGCVTYNEAYLFRGENPTLAKVLQFTNTNLHELAHQWFGNLITMKWWDDLWLNEAFATFMAFLVESRAQPLERFHDTVWV